MKEGMKFFYEILIEKERPPIDLSLEEMKKVPHRSITFVSYDKFVVKFTIDLVNWNQIDEADTMFRRLIHRTYKAVQITRLEAPQYLPHDLRGESR